MKLSVAPGWFLGWCLPFVLPYFHFDTHFLDLDLDALFVRRWKPTLVLDQAAQVFDLTGMAGVAVST
jgi:hypothetical protein